MDRPDPTPSLERVAATAITTALHMSETGIPYFGAIARVAKEIWEADHPDEVRPQAVDPKVNTPGIEVRYRLASSLIARNAQILDIAAGLTPRGLTMAEGRTYVELDLPIMIELKRRVLGRLAITGEIPEFPHSLHFEAGSVIDAKSVQRAARYFDTTRAIGVTSEGLLHYFNHEQKAAAARNIAVVLAYHPDSVWYTDIPLWKGIAERNSSMAKATTRQTGIDVSKNRFNTFEEIEEFFDQLGLVVVRRHSYADPELAHSLTSTTAVGSTPECVIAQNRPWSLYEIRLKKKSS